MNLNELIEALDQQFGNQYAPQRYKIIQEAVKELRNFQQFKEEYVGGLIKDAIQNRSAELEENK